MSNAVAAVSTTLKRGDGASSESFTAIGEILSMGQSGMTAELIDVTNLSSSGSYREYVTGFLDAGEIALECNFVLADYNTFKADFEARATDNYQIVFPDSGATTLDFAAYITNCSITANTGEQVKVAVTLKISGEITLTT